MLDHFVEESFALDQFEGLSLFNYPAFVQNDHLIIVGNRVQSMGHSYHSCLFELEPDHSLDESISLDVQVRGGLVKDYKSVVAKENSGQT